MAFNQLCTASITITTVQVDSGAAMLYGLLRGLKLLDLRDPYVTYC